MAEDLDSLGLRVIPDRVRDQEIPLRPPLPDRLRLSASRNSRALSKLFDPFEPQPRANRFLQIGCHGLQCLSRSALPRLWAD